MSLIFLRHWHANRDAPSNQNESMVAESFLHRFRNKTGLFASLLRYFLEGVLWFWEIDLNFVLLEQLHQLMHNCAKWKKWLILHNLSKKTPTLVAVKLCIYAQLL